MSVWGKRQACMLSKTSSPQIKKKYMLIVQVINIASAPTLVAVTITSTSTRPPVTYVALMISQMIIARVASVSQPCPGLSKESCMNDSFNGALRSRCCYCHWPHSAGFDARRIATSERHDLHEDGIRAGIDSSSATRRCLERYCSVAGTRWHCSCRWCR